MTITGIPSNVLSRWTHDSIIDGKRRAGNKSAELINIADLVQNGLYTTIPFVVQIFMKTFCSIVADAFKRKVGVFKDKDADDSWINSQGILAPTTAAKVFQTMCG